MEKIVLESWEEFEDQIRQLYAGNEELKNMSNNYYSDFLFRGQMNSKWKLETTLERFTSERFTIDSYNGLLQRIKNNIESFTNTSWLFEDYIPDNKKTMKAFTPPPNYELMTYLRHFGFPSPLLDWTRSPYVAAYFAFNNAKETNDSFVSIYCFQEWCGEGKAYSGSDAFITGLRANIKTHKRHYIQNSEYTICQKKNQNDYEYYSHEKAFKNKYDYCSQDYIFRYLLPTREKSKVLSKLDLMNINSYTLFGNEEALMEVLARKHID